MIVGVDERNKVLLTTTPFVGVKAGDYKVITLKQVPRILQVDRTVERRPLVGGISIGHWDITAGTLACPVMRDNDLYILSNSHVFCYSDDTEVLTKAGWKSFKDVNKDDEIATLNEKTDELEYQKPTAVIGFPYQGLMMHFKSRYLDLLVTPDHHFFLLKGRKKVPIHVDGKTLIEKLKKYPNPRLYFKGDFKWNCSVLESVVIPPAKVAGRYEQDYRKNIPAFPPEAFLRFLGWYLAEGSISKTGPGKKEHIICIRNTNPEHLKEIAETVEALGFKPYISKGAGVRFYSKQLFIYLKQFGYDHERFIPTEFKNLKREQLEILFQALMKGDGHKYRDRSGYVFLSCSKRLAEDVGEIAMKLGFRVRFSVKKGSPYNPSGIYYLTHISNAKLRLVSKNLLTLEQYKGMVYDVTVPNHIILVRRNGIPVWCGNCPSPWDASPPSRLEITQPGPYDVSKNYPNADLMKYVCATYKDHVPVSVERGSACPVARVWSGAYNSLASLCGAKTRLRPWVAAEANKVDCAIATPSVEFKDKILDDDGSEFEPSGIVGLLFAGSDVDRIFIACKASNIQQLLNVRFLHGIHEPQIGEVVHKCGRTTGHTFGPVLSTNMTLQVWYGVGYAPFEDCVVVSAACGGGDSGSLVYV
jgi:hypothetical protein